jgi:aldose 1-epimerase
MAISKDATFVFFLLATYVFVGDLSRCFSQEAKPETAVEKSTFGKLEDRDIAQFTLNGSSGAKVRIIEFGAIITEILVPDRSGKLANVVLATDSLEKMTQGFPAASVIGRYANRINGGSFLLEGERIQVSKNASGNHIHGGTKHFGKVVWQGAIVPGQNAVDMTYTAADGEEGFPGKLSVRIRYSFDRNNRLSILYEATTDKATVLNLTNHAYFNLRGTPSTVLDYELQIQADQYTVPGDKLIPTGEIAPVAGTPLDFRMSRKVGERIKELDKSFKGFDHNYVVNGEPGVLRPCVQLLDKETGRQLECRTTEPAVQLYTANHFNGSPYPMHGAICFETQHYPDSPNHPHFPTTKLLPGETFRSETQFLFSVNALP